MSSRGVGTRQELRRGTLREGNKASFKVLVPGGQRLGWEMRPGSQEEGDKAEVGMRAPGEAANGSSLVENS